MTILVFAHFIITCAAYAGDLDSFVVFNIPAQTLNKALLEFGSQAHVQIMFAPTAATAQFRSPQLRGRYTGRQALQILLHGTSLAFENHGDVVQVTQRSSVKPHPETPPTLSPDDPKIADTLSAGSLQEVIVTAEKTPEPLLEVPMSLTAISGSQLASSQFFNLQDYAGSIAGVSLIARGTLGTRVVIRGITSGSASINNPVATYIDETPFTAIGSNGSLVITPDLDTFDMQRIEVLRGPQGTLYGADALGGLLKYVTNAPDPSAFHATAEAGISSTYGGAVGHELHEMVNIPLTNNAALRLVGYGTYYPGYISDPSRDLKNTNGSHFTGGRASLLFILMPNLSIKLNALYQQRVWNDYSDEDVNPGSLSPIYGPLIQEKPISNSGQVVVQLYNATVELGLPIGQLLSTTSYYSAHPYVGLYYPTLAGTVSKLLGGSYGLALGYAVPVDALTQELRLTSMQTGTFRWLAGAYFTNQRQDEDEEFLPVSPSMHQILQNFSPNLGVFHVPSTYKEYAGYANANYDLTRTLTLGVGGRYSSNRQTFHETGTGTFGAGINLSNTSSEDVTTYSGDLRWNVLSGQMLYARVAEGYAPGGPNSVVVGTTLPSAYSATRTRDYEAGIKSKLLDNRLIVQLAGFHILWSRIQLLATIRGFTGTVNGGTAESNGFEWDIAYSPAVGLTANVNGSYTHARLTQDTPASVNGHDGDRLPGVPLWQGSLGLRYDHSLFAQYSAFASLNWQLTGSRYSDFVAASPRQTLPRFNILDLQTGIIRNNWSLALYVKNVANKLAINYVQPESLTGGLGPQDATIYPPRTVGVTVTGNFL